MGVSLKPGLGSVVGTVTVVAQDGGLEVWTLRLHQPLQPHVPLLCLLPPLCNPRHGRGIRARIWNDQFVVGPDHSNLSTCKTERRSTREKSDSGLRHGRLLHSVLLPRLCHHPAPQADRPQDQHTWTREMRLPCVSTGTNPL